jgi:hypothetical protein
LLVLVTASVQAEPCTISGPPTWCGDGPAVLCGPEGDWAYEWSGPEGFASGDRCISVSVPGTYTLIAYNPWLGSMLDPCSYTLVATPPPVATIEGPSTACTGSTARLCGPWGSYAWLWTAPDGAQFTTQCVDAAIPGTWTLSVSSASGGCTGAPATHTLAFTNCDTIAPPPPPPPLELPLACPRSASFWAHQCRSTQSAHRQVTGDELDALAACVNERATVFAWSDPTSGFCRTLTYRATSDLRARTLRQFAAVLANVCATSLGFASRGGALGLDASTPLTLDGAPPTVGAWVLEADAQLTALETSHARDRATTNAYKAILRTAWNINHGVGLGVTVCDATVRSDGFGEQADAEASSDDRSLTMAMRDAGGGLAIAPPAPNPFTAGTRVAFDVLADEGQEVVVTVHDLSGRMVRELGRGRWSPGSYTLEWDGNDATGRRVAAGVYFVRGSVGGTRVQSRVTMLR